MTRFDLGYALDTMEEKNEEIKWKSHPLVDEFPKSLLAIFLIIFFSVGTTLVFEHPLFGFITFIVLTIAMMPYFFPSYYRIDNENLHVRFLIHNKSRPLKHFRNFYVNPKGVHFSTFSKPSPLDPFRGTYVRFGKNKDIVLPYIKEAMSEIITDDEDEINEKE